MTDEAQFSLNSIGVDEAGRGALAGPVVAAAVILDPRNVPSGIADSKTLTPRQRDLVANRIRESAISWSVHFVDSTVIDRVNILQATYDAMHGAINEILDASATPVVELLIDGNRFRPHRVAWRCIVRGDAKNLAIAAASILAKVERDRWMIDVAASDYPVYGFHQHKGYGTAAHRERIQSFGPCPLHRKTFLTRIVSVDASVSPNM